MLVKAYGYSTVLLQEDGYQLKKATKYGNVFGLCHGIHKCSNI